MYKLISFFSFKILSNAIHKNLIYLEMEIYQTGFYRKNKSPYNMDVVGTKDLTKNTTLWFDLKLYKLFAHLIHINI